jgi:major type 1 subunit fimbrin (pilin)
MKKTLASLAVMGYLALSATVAHATDGTVMFAGRVVDATCTASIDGKGDTTTVELPTVLATLLDTAGKTAGEKSFTIAVAGCPAQENVKVRFLTGSTVDDATGNVLNMATSLAADNVQLQLLENGVPLQVGTSPGTDRLTDASGSATFPFAVQYVAVGGPAVSGNVLGSVTFEIDYD